MTLARTPKAQMQLAALAARKRKIEQLIQREMRKRLPCSLTLQRLKKLRLRIKDHVTSLGFWRDDRYFNQS